MYNKKQLKDKINKLPLFEIKELTEEGENAPDTFWKGVRETGKKGIVMPVSKNYKLMQFSQIFTPLVDGIDKLQGELRYYWGSGIMTVYPEGEQFKVSENARVGILITNSVNKTMGVNVNFTILMENKQGCYYYAVLPKELTQLRRRHMGNVEEIVKNYQKLLTNVQECWKMIVSKFSREVNEDEINALLNKLKLGKIYNKFINELYKNLQKVKLWDVFIDAVIFVSEKKYKNEINRAKRLNQISDIIYSFSMVEALKDGNI